MKTNNSFNREEKLDEITNLIYAILGASEELPSIIVECHPRKVSEKVSKYFWLNYAI